MSPSQAAAYERGLAAAMAQAEARPLSPYTVEAYTPVRARRQENWSNSNLFDYAKHNQINITTENDRATRRCDGV